LYRVHLATHGVSHIKLYRVHPATHGVRSWCELSKYGI
jgi:hypothetical protein